MKQRIFHLIIGAVLTALPTFTHAEEGMWLPCCLDDPTWQRMQQLGLELTPQQLNNPEGGSLVNAVVSFGGFCTGVVVSPDGLVLTNHHCGFESIQQHSTVDHDYLRDGFVAPTLADELPCPDLFVSFLVSTRDVTQRVLAAIPSGADEHDRSLIIDSITAQIVHEATTDTLLRAEVTPFYGGSEYRLSVYKDYSDVRLVLAPPSSMGKFGGDTDNWMWPRHTGDFSVFRIYADSLGHPAPSSPANVPYHPDTFAPISLSGYEEGSYCMTLGYPGSTSRYLSSYGVEERVSIDNQAKIDVRTVKQDLWKAAMERDPDIRIKYAAKYAHSSNYWKNSIGMNQSVKDLRVIQKKRALERELRRWVKEQPEERDLYATVLPQLRDDYESRREATRALAYFGEAFADGPDLLAASFALLSFDFEAEEEVLQRNRRRVMQIYADMDIELDKRVFVAMLETYAEKVDRHYLPEALRHLSRDSYQAFADSLYAHTQLATPLGFERLERRDSTFAFFSDPVTALTVDLMMTFYEIYQTVEQAEQRISRGERLLTAALRQMESERLFYPDANSTLRLSYGKVCGYSPRRGVVYPPFTTAQGILSKADRQPAVADYALLPAVRQFLSRPDYGPYATPEGEMNVCFLSDNDITGGNSGSGMFNARGELIGLAFDGNWEAMSGDLLYRPDLQRCIGVDIRYVLYIIEKYSGATRLIRELRLVSAGQ